MNTIVRNFMSVVRRFKLATVLNVLGLSVAFVAFMLIMMQVSYDNRFDSCQPEAERIFRFDLGNSTGQQAVIARPLARIFTESSPHIKAGCIVSCFMQDYFFSVKRNEERVNFMEKWWFASPEIMQVFDFKMLEGDDKALMEPNSCILPESLARKFFGNESAIGQQLIDQSGKAVTVKGVYHDFPRNSTLSNVVYVPLPEKQDYNDWGNFNYLFFVRLDDVSNKELIMENFKKNEEVNKALSNIWSGQDGLDYILTSLPELHFQNNIIFDTLPKANRQTLLVLSSIAIVILVIAGINFTNFSTSLAPMRLRSINTQKVLGSTNGMLRMALCAEAVGISLVAYLVSLYLLYVVKRTPIVSLIDAEVSFAGQLDVILLTGAIAVGVGLLAGLYPAFYMTSFQPAMVLKGNFGLSPTGKRTRNVLVGIQYVASFALIIGALFMYLQNHFMQSAPLGYDRDELIVSNLNQKINDDREALTNELMKSASVSGVTYSEFLLSSGDQYMGWGRNFRDESINYQCLPVDWNFLEVMGIQVSEGRGFRQEDDLKENGCYVFNETAKAQFDMKLGDKIGDDEIIGFMPDVKFASFRQAVSPMAFFLWGKYQRWSSSNKYYGQLYVKFKAGSDLRAGMEHVRQSLAKFDAEYPFNVRFFDEVLQQTYEQELKMGYLITLFSIVAILISIVGVFGLVVFESGYRRKEIAIRKVFGSTTGEILLMFNRGYLYILLICFALGAPVAWYGVSRWLENFAYRTPMYGWVLAVAFLVVALITVATVTFQSWRVANENPAENVKSE